jgi:hypothetical protein
VVVVSVVVDGAGTVVLESSATQVDTSTPTGSVAAKSDSTQASMRMFMPGRSGVSRKRN